MRRRPPYADPRSLRRLRARRRWLVSLVGVAVPLAVGGLVIDDALAVRGALAGVEARLRDTRGEFGSGDVEVASQHLAQARQDVAVADARTNRLLWQAGEAVPVAGRSLRITDAVVDVADAATDLGRATVRALGAVLGEDGKLDLRAADGRLELAGLRDAADSLDELDTGRLERALAELEAVPTGWVPTELQAGRRRALDLGGGALGTVERAGVLLDALPGFLGHGGPRHYFLAMQNNAELRGTGGLIGLFAVLTVEEGAFSLSEPQVYGVLDRDPDDPEEPLAPVATSDEFAARYGHVNAAGFFANVNVDPDFPTTSRVLLDLYAERTGQRLHGVIGLDPVGLGMLLEPIGPVGVPIDVTDRGLPNPVPPQQVAAVTMIDVYDAFGDDHPARKAWLQAFAVEAFDRIFRDEWDAMAVGRTAATAAARRHLQLFSEDETEQAAFVGAGLAGTMAAQPEPSEDLLAITANNTGGNKMDVHVGHTVSAEVVLGAVGEDGVAEREAAVRVALDNPLPSAGRPAYIIGSCLIDLERRACHEGPPGLNRTWFTLWTPMDTGVTGTRGAAGDRLLVPTDRIHGEHAVDHYLETPAGSTSHFEVDLSGPVQLTRDGEALEYRLRLWRQAKAIPDRLELSVQAPEGWRPVEASVAGGGDGSGLGVHGEAGPPLAVEVRGDRVRVNGDVNADVDVQVRFIPPPTPLWQRVVGWLRQPAF